VKRSSLPPRAAFIARSPIRRRRLSAAAARSKLEREYGSAARIAWVSALPSVVSGHGPCVNAHTATGGVSRKAHHSSIVPLTVAEHDELHQHGQQTFEAKYQVDLRGEAARVDAAWLALAEEDRG
jgi:hypothetical protein